MMDQRFSIGLRYRNASGHTINLSFCMPQDPKNAWVVLAEWEGALSCINEIP
uniref:Uncharacterized protein n=1 Tax=Octopus bimaculoides TaxID=37653 RepID=A0A0L8H2N4_OCTBM